MIINYEKSIPRIIFGLAIFILVFLGFFVNPGIFTNYSNQISIIITLFYVYLTYEILRTTKQSQLVAYINAEFILSSNIDEEFLKQHPELKLNERVVQLKKDDLASDPKNLVFLLIENVGETCAIEVKIDLKYERKNMGEKSEQHKNFNFGNLKPGMKSLELVDVYELPAGTDYFKVCNCETMHNTINSKFSSDGPTRKNISDAVTSRNNDEKVSILFKNTNNSF